MKNGPYILIIAPSDYPGKKYRGRYAYEHIVNFWKEHGRLPKKGHLVHHRNENKRDNNPGNLEENTVGEHNRYHNLIDDTEMICGWCGKKFNLKPSKYRERLKRNKFGKLFCSGSCGAKHQFSLASSANGFARA